MSVKIVKPKNVEKPYACRLLTTMTKPVSRDLMNKFLITQLFVMPPNPFHFVFVLAMHTPLLLYSWRLIDDGSNYILVDSTAF